MKKRMNQQTHGQTKTKAEQIAKKHTGKKQKYNGKQAHPTKWSEQKVPEYEVTAINEKTL